MSAALQTPKSVDDTPRAGRREWLGLGVLMLPVLLVSIDNTVLSFALAEISQSLRPSGTQLLWIVDIYPLFLAGLLVTMGTLGDRLGRRRLLLIGVAGFGVVSVFAAFSHTPTQLIVMRATLGIFGAMLMPATLALLRNLFLHREQRRLAIAIWASGFSAGSALGPIMGGWLLEHFWWGSIFLINAPVLILMLIIAPLLIPESRDPAPGKLNLLDVLVMIVTMLSFVFALKLIATSGDIRLGALLLGLSIGLGTWFVRRQLAASEPLLDVRLFTDRVFSSSVVTNLLSIAALTGLLYFASQYLQLVLGYRPMRASLFLVPGLIAAILAGLTAVRLARSVSIRILIPAGLVLAATGFILATQLHANTTVWLLVIAFFCVGAGTGLAQTLTNDAILASVDPRKAGAASGISETAFELGAVLGTAILGSILTGIYQRNLDLPAALTPGQSQRAFETLGGAVQMAQELPPALAEQVVVAARTAFATAVDFTSAAAALFVLSAAILVAVVLRRQPEISAA